MPNAASEKYEKALQHGRTIQARIGEALSDALKSLGSSELVRAELAKPRIKQLASIKRKAKKNGWPVAQAIEKCCDFVGFRALCNNLQDVSRAADLLEETLKQQGLKTERRDYIQHPGEDGYRAIHIRTRIDLAFGQTRMVLGAEVQIRTRLQDAWSRLSHADIYAAGVEPTLRQKMARLAATLARADTIAEQIRKEVTKPRQGTQAPERGRLTRSALAFVYRRAFGEDPPDYEVEWVMRELTETPIRADALDALLQDRAFMNTISEAYRAHTRWAPYPTIILQCAIRGAVLGNASARRLAHVIGKRDWQEIDSQYKSELAHSVPETWAELKEGLENGSADLENLIRYFDAQQHCFCGEEIVNFDSLADSVISHYGIEGTGEEYALIRKALDGADYCDSEGEELCAYHHHVIVEQD